MSYVNISPAGIRWEIDGVLIRKATIIVVQCVTPGICFDCWRLITFMFLLRVAPAYRRGPLNEVLVITTTVLDIYRRKLPEKI